MSNTSRQPYTFIGGELDGEKRKTDGRHRVHVSVVTKRSALAWSNSFAAMNKPTMEVQSYRMEILAADGKITEMYVLEGMSNFQAFRLLLEHYSPPKEAK